MNLLVEKKEGDEMVCNMCGALLICRMSSYKPPYQNKLQWQNKDGSAHYKYDGGKFSCTGDKEVRRALKDQDEMMKEAELSKGE